VGEPAALDSRLIHDPDVRGLSRMSVALTVFVLLAAGSGAATSTQARATDPPILVPWSRIGDIMLGEAKARVEHEYGSQRGYSQPHYRLHGGEVWMDYDSHGRVTDFGFTTRYYRTRNGLGVGSAIPLGACHSTPTNPCEHRWHGFVYNPRLREKPCRCWVKVGTGRTSLLPSGKNYEKPRFFIYLRQGHVSSFYFALRYID
jgi:hypothetical protein